MAQNDIFRMLTFATQLNSVYENTFAVRQKSTTDPTAASRQLLADDWKDAWRVEQATNLTWTTWQLRQLWGTGMTIVQSECRREGGVAFGSALTGTLTGGATGAEALPPQIAMVLTLTTGLIGRRKRGRIYAFGHTEDKQIGGTWGAAYMTSVGGRLATFFTKYQQGGTSSDWELGVWSERLASGCVINPATGHLEPRDTPLPAQSFTPVTGFLLRSTTFTQRRRTLGQGF